METVVLDFSGIDSRDALFRYLSVELALPEYFGNNLDALYDVLTEPGDYRVSLLHLDALRGALGDYADALAGVFADAGRLAE